MIAALVAALATNPSSQCEPPRTIQWQARWVSLDGEIFRRLTSRQLRKFIVGKLVEDPPRRHTVGQPWSTPWIMIFHGNGVATVFGDRDEFETPYRIETNAIRVNYEGFPPERLAFFRSADGDFAMGSYPEVGCMTVSRMTVKAAKWED